MKLVELLQKYAAEDSIEAGDTKPDVDLPISNKNQHSAPKVKDQKGTSIRPDECRICGSTDFWLKDQGGWVCNICHPDPKRPKNHTDSKQGGHHVDQESL